MDAYFHYELSHSTGKETFYEIIHMHFQNPYTIFEKSNNTGYIFVEDGNMTHCSQFFQSLCEDLYYDVFIMLSYADDAYSAYILSIAKKLSIAPYSNVSSITLKALMQMHAQTMHQLNMLFSPLNRDEIITIDSFLQNGCNTTNTSRALYIHRNTLRYRLQCITDKTGMNMHSFLAAQLFFCWYYH